MKIKVDGFEVEGTEDEVARLLSKLRSSKTKSVGANLTPKQREVYDALRRYDSSGAHYTVIADNTGLEAGIVNARLRDLVEGHPELAQRICPGTYVAVNR